MALLAPRIAGSAGAVTTPLNRTVLRDGSIDGRTEPRMCRANVPVRRGVQTKCPRTKCPRTKYHQDKMARDYQDKMPQTSACKGLTTPRRGLVRVRTGVVGRLGLGLGL